MHLLSTAFNSLFPVLLCLAVGSVCLWRYTRRAAPTFHSPEALLAVLLLAHPPLLLLLRFTVEREVAVAFTLTLFGSSLLVLRAVGPVFRLVLPPRRWRWLAGALVVLDATIAVSWSHLPPARGLVPGGLTASLVLGVEAAFIGLLLYWFWHAQQPGRLQLFLHAKTPPALALAQHAYDQQATDLVPTDAEFKAWLRTLPPSIRRVARRAGVGLLWALPRFRRFVLEARGQRCADFMAEHLSAAEFAHWVDVTYTHRRPGSGKGYQSSQPLDSRKYPST
jgi:hypothetical protein